MPTASFRLVQSWETALGHQSMSSPGRAAGLRQETVDARWRARARIREHGEDIPAVANWIWAAADLP
ncbi:hypothetical protein ACRS5S_05970 [Nocardia asiatica]|uniref:hypothetical protein n=1 Tax=Nocardia asiatica TaxID=209252 RepID=UPI003EE16211